MSDLQIHLFPYLSDNYGVLIHDPSTGATAAVDCGDADAYKAALERKGWKLTEIWITHHHWDHTQGLKELKAATGALVRGPQEKSNPIEGLDEHFWDGDKFAFAGHAVEVIATPGHTTDMINYYIPGQGVVFTGDTLFTLGCGRIFEGNAAMMWEGLQKLMALPQETLVYGSHEYTLANARFAVSVDPHNTALSERRERFTAMRERNEPTVPTTIRDELETNPFLRAGDSAIRKFLNMETATDSEVFAEIRKRKDNF